jgi:hypothetical protein
MERYDGDTYMGFGIHGDHLEGLLPSLCCKADFLSQRLIYGAGGASIAFVHPKATGGSLLGLSQCQ